MWWNKKVGRKREQGRLIPLRFGTVIRWLPFVPGLVALGRGSSAARSQQERKLPPGFQTTDDFLRIKFEKRQPEFWLRATSIAQRKNAFQQPARNSRSKRQR